MRRGTQWNAPIIEHLRKGGCLLVVVHSILRANWSPTAIHAHIHLAAMSHSCAIKKQLLIVEALKHVLKLLVMKNLLQVLLPLALTWETFLEWL
jgi:hypothetical protein